LTLVGGFKSGTLALPAALAAGGETAAAAAEAAEAAGALEAAVRTLTVLASTGDLAARQAGGSLRTSTSLTLN